MTKTSTPNDLIRFVYQETSDVENQTIERALLCNSDLLDEYIELRLVAEELDDIAVEPSQSSIDAVLSFSKSLHLPSVSN